jgi:hypothetical protein
MSDQFYEDDDDFDEADDKPSRSDSEWAELRRAKKAREKAEKELADMRKQMAFAKAGIDTDDPKTAYFVRAYEGEVTAEAIRAEAIKVGFIQEPTDDPNPADVSAQRDITEAALGAVPEGGANVDTGALDEAFRQGGTEGMLAYLRQSGVPINEVQ